MELITSTKNPKVKYFISLQESKTRRVENCFLIEGFREVNLAVESGCIIKTIIKCIDLVDELKFLTVEKSIKYPPEIIFVNKIVFDKIAYRENKDGLIAVAVNQNKQLDEIHLSSNPLIVVLESVEKPGNLGAILRTTDAAGVDAVIVCDPTTDIYNPNTIRSSLGCVFTNQVVSCSTEEAIAWLSKNKIKSINTALTEDAKNCYLTDFTEPIAIVMGSEAFGLSDKWLKYSGETVIIPMMGKIDSMNVSASCAVVVFEAVRQRKYSKALRLDK